MKAAVGEHASLELFQLLLDEVTIIPIFIQPFTMSQAVRLLGQKRTQVEPLISNSLPLDDAQ